MLHREKMLSSIAYSLLFASALAAPSFLKQRATELWQPAVGTKWQIVISQPVDATQTLLPTDAEVFDVDLFYTTAEDVANMKAQGKKVVCYYSAGSSENWRPDYGSFSPQDIGEPLQGWAGENWLNIRSASVLEVMRKRIELASEKGCDAIDPDNVDGYSNGGGGFGLTTEDSVKYIQEMASIAAGYGMSTGLKNAQEVLTSVLDSIQFAVNEECAFLDPTSGCLEYTPLLDAGKPVFHIEYLDENQNGSIGASVRIQEQSLSQQCLVNGIGNRLSTVVKYLALDGFVEYCDGSQATTAINNGFQTGDPKQGGDAHRV